MGHGPVVDALIASGRIEESQVTPLPKGKPPEQQLLEAGTLTARDILDTLSEVYSVPAVLLAEEEIDPDAVALVPQDMAMNCKVLPLRRLPDKIVLAMADPTDVVAEDFVRFVTGFDIERVAAMTYELQEEIDKRFKPQNAKTAEVMNSALEELAQQQGEKQKAAAQAAGELPEEEEAEREKEASNSAPVVKAVHSLLSEGVLQKASDIHFEPVATGLRVRYRIDGYLREITELPRMVQPMVLSRIKLQSGMDISEKRKPQDGRTRLQVGDREIDFRVSSLPTFYGEKVVMRILDSKKAAVAIEVMGWSERDLATFLDFIRMPQGAILITGPTGSGKTSTLYAALARLHTPDVNIVTVEDPVEFQISGINQVQVNNKAGLTFASALRSILRQDPNIVILGEIRDAETANIAFEAAMTGHLVLSTLHTNDAPSAISRLIHVGVPHYLVASSLVGAVAQRLVRKLCKECRSQGPITPDMRDILERSGLKQIPDLLWYAGGCKSCGNTGYTGRMGIFEVLRVTEQIRAAIYADASEQQLKEIAKRQGLASLLEDGLRKAEQGLTSLEEVLNVAPAGTEVAGDDDDEGFSPSASRGGHGGHGGHGGGHGNGAHNGSSSRSQTSQTIQPVFVVQMPGGQTMPLSAIQMPAGQMPQMMPQMMPMASGSMMLPPGQAPYPMQPAQMPYGMPLGAPSPMHSTDSGIMSAVASPLDALSDASSMDGNADGSSVSGVVEGENPDVSAESESAESAQAGGQTDMDPDSGSITCVCGNSVAASQPYCNVCGNILEVATRGGGAAPSPTKRAEPAHRPPPMPPPQQQYPSMGYGQMPYAAMQPPMAQAPAAPCSCGAWLTPSDKFCNNCGAPSPFGMPPNGNRPGGMIACACGNMVPATSRFCNNCGSPVQMGGAPQALGARPPQGGQAPYPPQQGPSSNAGRRDRILVVDDDPDLLTYVQRLLELEFYDVTVAHDGQEGLTLALSSAPDLIILDISMPGMDGVALCRKLRTHYQTRGTPIILLTGLVGVDDESRALEAGADDYLTKPVNPTRLVARVEAHLRRVRMRSY